MKDEFVRLELHFPFKFAPRAKTWAHPCPETPGFVFSFILNLPVETSDVPLQLT